MPVVRLAAGPPRSVSRGSAPSTPHLQSDIEWAANEATKWWSEQKSGAPPRGQQTSNKVQTPFGTDMNSTRHQHTPGRPYSACGASHFLGAMVPDPTYPEDVPPPRPKTASTKFHQESHFSGGLVYANNETPAQSKRQQRKMHSDFHQNSHFTFQDSDYPEGDAKVHHDERKIRLNRFPSRNNSNVCLAPAEATPQKKLTRGGRKKMAPSWNHPTGIVWSKDQCLADIEASHSHPMNPTYLHTYSFSNSDQSVVEEPAQRVQRKRPDLSRNFGVNVPFGTHYGEGQDQNLPAEISTELPPPPPFAIQGKSSTLSNEQAQQPQTLAPPPLAPQAQAPQAPAQAPPAQPALQAQMRSMEHDQAAPQAAPTPGSSVRPHLSKNFGGVPPYHLPDRTPRGSFDERDPKVIADRWSTTGGEIGSVGVHRSQPRGRKHLHIDKNFGRPAPFGTDKDRSAPMGRFSGAHQHAPFGTDNMA